MNSGWPKTCPARCSVRCFPTLPAPSPGPAPNADLEDVRQSALILLYRLLFILYAEDRDLLPVRARMDKRDVFSDTAANCWNTMTELFGLIDRGDGSIGLPSYNGGLFDHERHRLLTRIRIPDTVTARVIDALSFEASPEGRKYINYRNLSVQQLGSIYERLLEYGIKRLDWGEIIVEPDIFARKGSGSYYTPDDLVQLILHETLQDQIKPWDLSIMI